MRHFSYGKLVAALASGLIIAGGAASVSAQVSRSLPTLHDNGGDLLTFVKGGGGGGGGGGGSGGAVGGGGGRSSSGIDLPDRSGSTRSNSDRGYVGNVKSSSREGNAGRTTSRNQKPDKPDKPDKPRRRQIVVHDGGGFDDDYARPFYYCVKPATYLAWDGRRYPCPPPQYYGYAN